MIFCVLLFRFLVVKKMRIALSVLVALATLLLVVRSSHSSSLTPDEIKQVLDASLGASPPSASSDDEGVVETEIEREMVAKMSDGARQLDTLLERMRANAGGEIRHLNEGLMERRYKSPFGIYG